MGSGGSGTAIFVHLMTRRNPEDRPARIVMVGNDRESLDDLERVHDRIPEPTPAVAYVENKDPAANDELLSDLPPASLVVNATGMGKDIPGSPFTAEAVYPENGLVWELNYRGELDFLRQAHRQVRARGLSIQHAGPTFCTAGARSSRRSSTSTRRQRCSGPWRRKPNPRGASGIRCGRGQGPSRSR